MGFSEIVFLILKIEIGIPVAGLLILLITAIIVRIQKHFKK
jgi:hypothetical protein